MPTNAAAPTGAYLTIADLTARYGSAEFWRREITSGRLAALDVSRPGASRSAYRIPASAVAEWEASRAVTPAEKKPIPRRRRKPAVKQYV